MPLPSHLRSLRTQRSVRCRATWHGRMPRGASSRAGASEVAAAGDRPPAHLVRAVITGPFPLQGSESAGIREQGGHSGSAPTGLAEAQGHELIAWLGPALIAWLGPALIAWLGSKLTELGWGGLGGELRVAVLFEVAPKA